MNLSERSFKFSKFSRGTRLAVSCETLALIVVKSSVHSSIIELNFGKK